MDYKRMWENLKMYTEELKAFTETIDTHGVEKAQSYKDGLNLAYSDIAKTIQGLEKIHSDANKEM